MVLPIARRRPITIKASHPKLVTRKLIRLLEELAAIRPAEIHALEVIVENNVKRLLARPRRRIS